MRLKVDEDRMTIDDMIFVEEGLKTPRAIRDFLARFTVNEAGEYLDEAAARSAIGKLTITELRRFMGQFQEAVEGLQAAAVPPTAADA